MIKIKLGCRGKYTITRNLVTVSGMRWGYHTDLKSCFQSLEENEIEIINYWQKFIDSHGLYTCCNINNETKAINSELCCEIRYNIFDRPELGFVYFDS